MRNGFAEAAAWALALTVFWAWEDGQAEYDVLIDLEPQLAETWIAGQLVAGLKEHGSINLF